MCGSKIRIKTKHTRKRASERERERKSAWVKKKKTTKKSNWTRNFFFVYLVATLSFYTKTVSLSSKTINFICFGVDALARQINQAKVCIPYEKIKLKNQRKLCQNFAHLKFGRKHMCAWDKSNIASAMTHRIKFSLNANENNNAIAIAIVIVIANQWRLLFFSRDIKPIQF